MGSYQQFSAGSSARITNLGHILACVSSVVVITMALVSCTWPGLGGGSNGGGGSSDSPVIVNVRYVYPSMGALHCTGVITWTFTPIQLTGSQGKSAQIKDQKTYDELGNLASRECVLGDGQV